MPDTQLPRSRQDLPGTDTWMHSDDEMAAFLATTTMRARSAAFRLSLARETSRNILAEPARKYQAKTEQLARTLRNRHNERTP